MASPNKSLKQVLQATLQCTKKDDWYVLSNKCRKSTLGKMRKASNKLCRTFHYISMPPPPKELTFFYLVARHPLSKFPDSSDKNSISLPKRCKMSGIVAALIIFNSITKVIIFTRFPFFIKEKYP